MLLLVLLLVAQVDTSAQVAQARKLIADGRPKEAIASLKDADPTLPAIGHVLGVAYYHADDHQRAIELLSAVRDKLPEGSMERREAVQVLGLCYYLTGRYSDAIPLLE